MPSPLKVKVQYLKPWEQQPTITYSSANPVSDSNGGANLSITITGKLKVTAIGGDYIDHFLFVFDQASGQYATEIVVRQYSKSSSSSTSRTLLSETTHTNADIYFPWHSTISSPAYSGGYSRSSLWYDIEIDITKWSAPNSNIIIDALTGEYSVEYTKTKIREASREFKTKAEIAQPSFGVYSQGAKCRVVDYDESILALSQVDALTDGLTVTYTLGTKEIGHFVTSNWKYDIYSHEVTMNLNDHLLALQDEKVSVSNLLGDNLLDELNKLSGVTGINVFYGALFAQKISAIYESTVGIVGTPYFSDMSKWDVWNAFCVAFHFHLYEGIRGITIDKSSIHTSDEVVDIPSHRIVGNPKTSPIHENKYENVRWKLANDDEPRELNSIQVNVYEMETNSWLEETLVAPTSSGGAEPLHEALANDILRRYQRGMETMELNVLVPSQDDFITPGMVVRPLNRRGQPLADKNWLVVGADYTYDGTHSQKLILEQF